jgi:hypothetical protein
MTAIAHMPDNAVANGAADDTTALQQMFNACPSGGLCIIPDGVYRVTNTIQPNKPMNVWCSPGAHIKGDFTGTQAVVWAFWHTPNGTSDLYVGMETMFWQGGVISRLNRNGPCLRMSAGLSGGIQNVRTLRGSPHIWIDAPDTVDGWYRGGAGPNWGAARRVTYCRGLDGGPFGIQIGQTPGFPGSGQSNGDSVEHCYFQGNGAAGSRGLQLMNGGSVSSSFNTFDNYEIDVRLQSPISSRVHASNKRAGSGTTQYSANGTSVAAVIFDRRAGVSGPAAFEFAGRDPSGAYNDATI